MVVKASGLAAGKGVIIPTTPEETISAVKEIMADSLFGAAGDTCVIESFLTGPEVSCICFTDGHDVVMCPPAQDHKRAYDNDEGPNTGGMGVFAPVPSNVVSPCEMDLVTDYCRMVVRKMKSEGRPYKGILYAGALLPTNIDDKRPSLLEFNCRFGGERAKRARLVSEALTCTCPLIWTVPEQLPRTKRCAWSD